MPSIPTPKTFTIGERSVTLGCLTLREARPILKDLDALSRFIPGTVPTAEQVDAMLRIVHASAKMVQPEITLADVEATFLDAPLSTMDALEELCKAFAFSQTASVPPAEKDAKKDATPGEAASL